jgi:hypothetical protein
MGTSCSAAALRFLNEGSIFSRAMDSLCAPDAVILVEQALTAVKQGQ